MWSIIREKIVPNDGPERGYTNKCDDFGILLSNDILRLEIAAIIM